MSAANKPPFDSRNGCLNYLAHIGYNRKSLRGMPFGKLQNLAKGEWDTRNLRYDSFDRNGNPIKVSVPR